MGLIGDLRMYRRFLTGLPRFLERRVTPEEAAEIIRERLATREERFLRIVERSVFGYPRSPYRELFKLAGCGLEDLKELVAARGLEGALRVLREAGVYVSFEEFKGREPLVRGGREIPVTPGAFDNPFIKAAYEAQSGGTTGAGTRLPMDLDFIADQVPEYVVFHQAHGMLGAPVMLWRGVLPDTSGLSNVLRYSLMGHTLSDWFSTELGGGYRPSFKNRLAMRAVLAALRHAGIDTPTPRPAGYRDAVLLARTARSLLDRHGNCIVRGGVSLGMRVALAAREAGIDLTGAFFLGGGEPPTPAKVRAIIASGGRWIPQYPFTEGGLIGAGCASPVDGNDLHLFTDKLALITHPRSVPGNAEITVDAFHFTSLLPSAPRILLNAESDDYGIVEERPCGCPLAELGLTTHLREVRSFRKLTGEGVTLVGGEMVRILEEVLPERFGGSALDYQLLEEEDERGLTRLYLLVSPRLRIEREADVVDAVMEAMHRGSAAANLAQVIWGQDGTLRVRRQEPVLTGRGKLMPLHLLSKGEKK